MINPRVLPAWGSLLGRCCQSQGAPERLFSWQNHKKTCEKEVDLICMATAAKKGVRLFTKCTQFFSYGHGAIATESRLRFKLNSDLEIFLRSSWHVWSWSHVLPPAYLQLLVVNLPIAWNPTKSSRDSKDEAACSDRAASMTENVQGQSAIRLIYWKW